MRKATASLPALRAGLSLVLLAYLLSAWGSSLDRMSGQSPPLERLVPGPFRIEAERGVAAVALLRGDEANALKAATRAVRADPVNSLSNALLGAARYLGGDPAGADAAFRVSGQLGWRARLTQLYWYDVAMRSDDTERAAMRLDALLRAEPRLPSADNLLAPLEASEKGRGAIAQRLALHPIWVGSYLHPSAELPPERLSLRTDVVLNVAAQGSKFDCKDLASFTRRLLDEGMQHQALSVWKAHCGDPGIAGGLADTDFQRIAKGNTTSPFGWRLYPSGDVTTSFGEAPAGERYELHAGNLGSVSRLLMSQAIEMRPGRYRIKATVNADGKAARGRVFASLDCGGSAKRTRRVVGELAGDGQLLELGQCSGVVFGLWLRPGTNDVEIGNIRLERADDPAPSPPQGPNR